MLFLIVKYPRIPLAFLATRALLAHEHLLVPQDPQVLLHRAALQLLTEQVCPQPVLVQEVIPSQLQDPILF